MQRVVLLTHQASTGALLRSVSGASRWELLIRSQWADVRSISAVNDAAASKSLAALVMVVDLATLSSARVSAERAVTEIKRLNGAARIVLLASGANMIDAVDERWAQMCGADLIIPALSALRWDVSGVRLQTFIAASEGIDPNEVVKRSLPFVLAAQRLERSNTSLANLAAVEASGLDLAQLARRMARSGGVEIKHRTYRLRGYPDCFIASEAVLWIKAALGVSDDAAISIGLALQEAGLIYHVAREQSFAAEFLFFRASATPASFVLADFVSLCRSASGFDVRDRDYMGTNYPRCFVGNEAVAQMQKRGLSLNEAMSVGERMLRLSIISHVLGEHPFQDASYFYRFGDERAS